MKKFLAIALIAASLTSCGGGKTEETPATDSAAVTVDTTVAAPAVDTAAAVTVDTTAAAPAAAPAEEKK
jgi:PBP1b-binding outer membrane lipoprotein LpoB